MRPDACTRSRGAGFATVRGRECRSFGNVGDGLRNPETRRARMITLIFAGLLLSNRSFTRGPNSVWLEGCYLASRRHTLTRSPSLPVASPWQENRPLTACTSHSRPPADFAAPNPRHSHLFKETFRPPLAALIPCGSSPSRRHPVSRPLQFRGISACPTRTLKLPAANLC